MKEYWVHEKALCESDSIGKGTKIWAFAHVMGRALIGAHCNIGDHSFIEENAVIGDHVTIKNQVLIWEGVTVENDCFIGPGVTFTNDLYPRSPRMQASCIHRKYKSKNNWLLKQPLKGVQALELELLSIQGSLLDVLLW